MSNIFNTSIIPSWVLFVVKYMNLDSMMSSQSFQDFNNNNNNNNNKNGIVACKCGDGFRGGFKFTVHF